MGKRDILAGYFAGVETTREHSGYFCSVGETLTIVILGTFCGLRNIKQIHQWASDERVSEFLGKEFGIKSVPCYYWMTCLMKLIKPDSLDHCFMKWIESILPEGLKGYTVAVDGKTIRSTGKMSSYDSAMHIVSAHLAEIGITIGQKEVGNKSNEIPAVRELLIMLEIKGCMVVADAMNCHKETAKVIVDAEEDYLLSVKDNQKELKEEIETYVLDDELRVGMDKATTVEKNGGRIEKRTAYVSMEIDWLYGKDKWSNLSVIGAIHREVSSSNGNSSEWHTFLVVR